jgi:hypothetical protein
MYELTRANIHDAAVSTLVEIWSQIDWDKVTGQRAMGIWDEFSSKVKASAMTTNSYEKFVEKLCRKMEVRSLKFRTINEITNESEEFKKAILKAFREETQVIVLKLRLNNQIRKEQEQQEKIRKEKEKALADKLENAQVVFTEKGVKVHEN